MNKIHIKILNNIHFIYSLKQLFDQPKIFRLSPIGPDSA